MPRNVHKIKRFNLLKLKESFILWLKKISNALVRFWWWSGEPEATPLLIIIWIINISLWLSLWLS